MKTHLLLAGLALFALVVGLACSTYHPHATEPLVRELPWQEAPGAAYDRALLLAQRAGGTWPIVMQPGVFRFTVHRAAELTVAVVSMPSGHPQAQTAPTLVTVSGLVLPHQLVLGALTEVDDFLRLFVASDPQRG